MRGCRLPRTPYLSYDHHLLRLHDRPRDSAVKARELHPVLHLEERAVLVHAPFPVDERVAAQRKQLERLQSEKKVNQNLVGSGKKHTRSRASGKKLMQLMSSWTV